VVLCDVRSGETGETRDARPVKRRPQLVNRRETIETTPAGDRHLAARVREGDDALYTEHFAFMRIWTPAHSVKGPRCMFIVLYCCLETYLAREDHRKCLDLGERQLQVRPS
jgi:hypothetical protein